MLSVEYQKQKEATFKIGIVVANCDFVETLSMLIETSGRISGGLAIEVMGITEHLLKCKKVCKKHHLMRETIMEK